MVKTIAPANKDPYYISLTINDDAIGWCVLNKDYTLQRAKGKDMWGTRELGIAETSADCRLRRASRRSLKRAKARIKYLQEMFNDAIEPIDPMFFTRLKESYRVIEDRSEGNKQKNSLFNDLNFTDKEYQKTYPTIYHLNNELLESADPHDPRLVYLCLHHYLLNRGHFHNNTLSTSGNDMGIEESFKLLLDEAEELKIKLDSNVSPSEMLSILSKAGTSRTKKRDSLLELFGIPNKKSPAREVVNLLCGLNASINEIFKYVIDDMEKTTLSFNSKEDLDESINNIKSMIGESNALIIDLCRNIYDIAFLHNIMKGEKYFSRVMTNSYQEHKQDLKLLKDVLNRYDHDLYKKMFSLPAPNNYSGYVGHCKLKGKLRRHWREGKKVHTFARDRAGFYTEVKKVLSQLPQEDPDIQFILEKIEFETFMPKQKTLMKAQIPNQVYMREVQKIVDNASTYLEFFNDVDPDYDLTTKEKILDLMNFTRPYYVGVITDENYVSRNWTLFKEGKYGRILPWNLDDMIDLDQSMAAFIESLIGTCTYYPDQKVLPRHSLMYERFVCLNELNTLRVNNERPSVEFKQHLFNTLYMTGKRVTLKMIEKEAREYGLIDENSLDAISFNEGGTLSYLGTYGKFVKILGAEFVDTHSDMIEDLIYYVTVYGDSKNMLVDFLSDKYQDELSAQEIRSIANLGLSEWGNLSKKFFMTTGTRRPLKNDDSETEKFGTHTLLDALWVSNYTHQELLGNAFTFRDTINDYNDAHNKVPCLEDWTNDMFTKSYLHAALKRGIWQVHNILMDILEVKGYYPELLFIEHGKGKGKVQSKLDRKKTLLSIYKKMKDAESVALRKQIEETDENDFKSYKLYLYYLQKGRDLYTGKPIDRSLLNTSTYDRDHIYPRSLTNDNSIANNLVLVNQDDNRRKSNKFPIDPAIQDSQIGLWKELKTCGLMSAEKFYRLTRKTVLTPEELAGYITNETVDNRSGSRQMERLLTAACKNKGTRVILVKSTLIDEFRHTFGIYEPDTLNVCKVAHDAYIAAVAGNAYDAAFTSNPLNFVLKKGEKPEYNLAKVYDVDRSRGNEIVWRASKSKEDQGTIATVKKTVKKNSCIWTKMLNYNDNNNGNLYNMTVVPKITTQKCPERFIGVKTKDSPRADVTKYGGRESIKSEGWAVVSYDIYNKKTNEFEKNIELMGVMRIWGIKSKDDPKLLDHLTATLQKKEKGKASNIKVLLFPVRFNTKVQIDGYTYFIGGYSSGGFYVTPAIKMVLPEKMLLDLKKIERAMLASSYDAADKLTGERYVSKEKNTALYDEILNSLQNRKHAKRVAPKTFVAELGEAKGKFMDLKVEKQCKVLSTLFSWLRGTNRMIDLQEIGLTAHAGTSKLNCNLKNYQDVVIQFESPSGLLERKVQIK